MNQSNPRAGALLVFCINQGISASFSLLYFLIDQLQTTRFRSIKGPQQLGYMCLFQFWGNLLLDSGFYYQTTVILTSYLLVLELILSPCLLSTPLTHQILCLQSPWWLSVLCWNNILRHAMAWGLDRVGKGGEWNSHLSPIIRFLSPL